MTRFEIMVMYLPHNTILYRKNSPDLQETKLLTLHDFYNERYSSINYLPVLYPLSDIDKIIIHKGKSIMLIEELLNNNNFNVDMMERKDIMSYKNSLSMPELIHLNDLPIYLKYHFDVFCLIEKCQAIDINTLKINPYE